MRSAILACAVLLVAGCIGQDGESILLGKPPATLQKDPRDDNESGPRQLHNDPSACERNTGKMRDLCWANTASDMRDISLCDRIKEPFYKEICYGRIGVLNRDPKLCDRIGNATIRAQCKVAASQ
jgi:hypothetical protein